MKYKEITKNTTITFRIEQADKDRLQQIVREKNCKSLSSLMEEIVQEYLLREK